MFRRRWHKELTADSGSLKEAKSPAIKSDEGGGQADKEEMVCSKKVREYSF